jgi:hypothetical protein
MENPSVREYLANPDQASCNNFYDWFCKDTSLPAKQIALDTKVRKLINSPRINQDTMYVFYKNNCPMVGGLYDSFSFCNKETGDVVYWITPKSGHKSCGGQAEVCGPENDFAEPLFAGSWSDLVKWFNAPTQTI